MKKQVDGLFILAKFKLNEIKQKRHPSVILKSFKPFLKETNELPNETLANPSITISEKDAYGLIEILRWGFVPKNRSRSNSWRLHSLWDLEIFHYGLNYITFK